MTTATAGRSVAAAGRPARAGAGRRLRPQLAGQLQLPPPVHRRVPPRARAAGRRRGAHPHPGGRPGNEHRDHRRPQPGLEAGPGRGRPGPRGAPRHLRLRTRACRGVRPWSPTGTCSRSSPAAPGMRAHFAADLSSWSGRTDTSRPAAARTGWRPCWATCGSCPARPRRGPTPGPPVRVRPRGRGRRLACPGARERIPARAAAAAASASAAAPRGRGSC
jgi:hypothetical protein